MEYRGTLIRPPSEAGSFIFQITYGCSDNNCIFCPAYKEQKFHVRAMKEIKQEIKQASIMHPYIRRIFLADGDALIVEQEKLIEIFDYIEECFPRLTRISMYGSIKSLKDKSMRDLIELREKKLGVIYLGIETGDNEVYSFIRKYGSPEENVSTCKKIKDVGIKLNTTVILGLGGKRYTENHAINTAKVLNKIQPDQMAFLTLMIMPNTEIYKMLNQGKFEELDKIELLCELKTIVSKLDKFTSLFFSNHASNYYNMRARFPKDKAKVMRDLNYIINHRSYDLLTPDHFRGL